MKVGHNMADDKSNVKDYLRQLVSENKVKEFAKSLSKLSEDDEEVESLLGNLLFYSSELGHADIVATLLLSGAPVDFVNLEQNSNTALNIAVRNGHIHCAKILLDYGISLVLRNNHGYTALDLACARNDIKIVELILRHERANLRFSETVTLNVNEKEGVKIRLNETAQLFYTAMIEAAQNNSATCLRRIINTGVDVNLNLDKQMGTPLHAACESGSEQCVDILLSNGANCNILRQDSLDPPIVKACANGHPGVVKQLILAGADLNLQTPECSAPLCCACHYGHTDVVKLLLEHGSNPNLLNPFGFTALYLGGDVPEIVECLLTVGAEVNTRCGERQETVFHLACVIGNVDCVNMLLEAGSDIFARTVFNETAMWLAAWKERYDVGKILVNWKCELNVPSNGYKVYIGEYIPIEITIGLGQFKFTQLLFAAGACMRNGNFFQDGEEGHLEEVPWLCYRKEVLECLEKNAEMLQWVVAYLKNPRSLREVCRLKIRDAIGQGVIKSVKMLPLPSQMQQYLLFSDIDV